MVSKKLVYTLVAIVSAFWGLSFLATAELVKVVDPIQIQSIRWMVAAIIIGIYMKINHIGIDFHKRDAKYLFLTGLCEPCIYMMCETYGIMKTSASISAIFIATIPCVVLILDLILFRESPGRTGVAGILLAFTGVTVCTVCSPAFAAGGEMIGYILLIGAVIAGGVYSIFVNYASTEYSSIQITFVMAVMGTIYYNVLNFILGYGTETYTIYFHEPKLLAEILFLGVCCSAICYLAFNRLIALVDPAVGNNLSASMVTAVGVAAGVLIAGDPAGWYTVIGLALTLFGVYLSSRQLD